MKLKKIYLICGFVTVFLLISGCKTKETSEKQSYRYWLTVNKGQSESKDEIDANNQQVLILINDNPLRFYFGAGGTTDTLNLNLKPGKNTIILEGHFDVPLYVQIQKMKQVNGSLETEKVILDNEIKSLDKQWEKEFDVDITYTLPIFEANNLIPGDKENDKKEILKIICELYQSFLKRDSEELDKLFEKYSDIKWFATAYGISGKQIKELQDAGKQVIDSYMTEDMKIQELDPNSVKFIFGRNYVTAYIDFHGISKMPYLFSFINKDKKTIYHPSIDFAYINNRWFIWP